MLNRKSDSILSLWSKLALCALLFSFFRVHAEGITRDSPVVPIKPASITVVLDDNYPPYIFRDSSGKLQGILKDSWTLWGKHNNISVNLQAMDWAKAQEVMQSGKADVIDTLFITEARSHLYDFSEPYATLPVPIFFHKSITGIAGTDSLKGFTVGVKDGDACIDFLQSQQITSLKRYPGYEVLIRAAGEGEVRVFCMDEPPAIHFLYKLGLEKEFRHSLPLYIGQFHRAYKRGDHAMQQIVESGFKKISAGEQQIIAERWMGKSPLNEQIYDWIYKAAYVLLAIGILSALLLAWNNILRRSVKRKTRELNDAIHSLKESKQETEEARDNLAVTLKAIPDQLFELDINGRYLDYHSSREDLLVVPPEKFLGQTVFDVMPRNSAAMVVEALNVAFEKGMAHDVLVSLSVPAGKRWFELSIARKPISEGITPRFIVLSRDVSERIQAQNEIERLAFYDPLTQLPNRRLLIDRLHQAMSASQRRNQHGALLIVDIDDFRTLNDTKGHSVGDMLLKEIASRVKACLRLEDSIARVGGDEFAIMLEGLSGTSEEAAMQAELVGEKILQEVSHPCILVNHVHHATASIGISLFFGDADNEEEILKRADSAMYRAKSSGRNSIRFFDPDIQANLEARAALETELRQTIEHEQLRLYYQAQVTSGEKIFGAEALIRWIHPLRGMISPAEFIPLAEETGLIVPIGLWVLETACAQIKLWEANPQTCDLLLSINVSARQFRQSDFVERVLSVLEATGANPARLKIELTESLVLDDVTGSIEKMHALKSHGVGFSMDDFGTGYSSLSYLRRLPLDQLKIDQSFVRDIVTDHGDAIIVQTIIGMAHNLGLNVIAEGVETEAQRDFLTENNCLAYQGFLFSRPIPLVDFETLLTSQTESQNLPK